MYLIKNPKTIKHKLHAVSPVVATLVLIVVAIVGAIAVGLIMSRVASDTSNQATVGGVASGSQGTLLIGGSTTIYPVTQAAIASFEDQYHVTVVDAQGGSGAGMQGVISGAINIGAASSSSAVYTAETYITDNSITGVNLNPVLIGGSGVVFVTQTNPPVAGGAFLTDGVGADTCQEFTAAAINAAYNEPNGQFFIGAGDCVGHQVLAADIFATAAAAGQPVGTLPFQTYSRSDNSGTADTVTSWLTGSTVSTYPYANSVGEVGNPGVLSTIQKCSTATVAGCLGFVDLGFAEGAAAGVSCQSGWTASTPCNVAIIEASSGNTLDTLQTQVKGNGYVAPLASTADLHAFVLTALQNYANINPLQTANPSTNVYPDSGGSLARSFYYVTNGSPTPIEQDWLNFLTSPDPSSQAFFNNNGYFTVYQMSGA